MTIAKFEIGQTVWAANSTRKAERVLCPVCFAKGVVILELGNGSRVEIDCDYCSRGFKAPDGYVDGNWTWEGYVNGPYTIVGVRVETDEGETEILYWVTKDGGKIGLTEERLAVTSEGAQRLARELGKSRQERELKDKAEKKEKAHKSYSWHVGYHLKEAARASAAQTYHEGKAKFMETKVRKPKEV